MTKRNEAKIRKILDKAFIILGFPYPVPEKCPTMKELKKVLSKEEISFLYNAK